MVEDTIVVTDGDSTAAVEVEETYEHYGDTVAKVTFEEETRFVQTEDDN